ncbi:MAG: c-type cytochrome [Pirellulaceae bacterium]|jgi:putative membrane-bound dehydrogenase-like protein|nr:c-type cytochrome [Pirellulaceae bacterium]
MAAGFRVEVVAAEPDVRDPVALDIDESGRMYVAELPQYNSYVVDGFAEKGSIRLLEDTDADGRYDKSTKFATGLSYPTAVACWKGGVFVGAAPDLLYFKDTDGDGVADQRRVVLTGFGSDRAGEAHLNSIRWHLDNRFHFSTSLSGGDIGFVEGEKKSQPISARGRGIVMNPQDPGRFELTTGAGQHGMSMDDWGWKFVCSNSVPAQMLMYDDRYLARNPYAIAPAAAVNIAPQGKFTKLFRLTANEPWRVLRTRLRKEGKFRGSDEGGKPFGFFTGATGVTIYRGDAWPASYRGNLLVGDVANNLIYRARLDENGITRTAIRADEGGEFLASRDIWFRPVQMANAPDGTIYVLDMYRELIEGAAFLPSYFMDVLDPVGGHERGRIYRIAYTGAGAPAPRRQPPRLGDLSAEKLVALLDHANGWHRDTAARLIYERQDAAAVPALRALIRGGETPIGRATALAALNGLNRVREDDILVALGDKSPRVRAHGLRVAESAVDDSAGVASRMEQLIDDDDPIVRYQLAYSLGASRTATRIAALASLARQSGQDPYLRAAILSSLRDDSGALFARLIQDRAARQDAAPLLVELAAQIGAANRTAEVAAVLQGVNSLPPGENARAKQLVAGLLKRAKGDARAKLLAATSGAAEEVVAEMIAQARRTALSRETKAERRAAAVRGMALAKWRDAQPVLTKLLDLRQPPLVQAAAVEVIGGFSDDEAAHMLLTAWSRFSPQLRARAAEALLSRPAWLELLLDAVEQKRIAPGDLDPARIALLKLNPDKAVAARVEKLFSQTGLARRTEVVAQFESALRLEGNFERGRAVFKKNCSACHQLDGVGTQVGANLRGIAERGMRSVMLNVLDPNREVKPKFLSYIVHTEDGLVLTGMIISENANTLTLQRPDATQVVVQRVDIESLKSTGLSFMPEGLEKELTPQAMADVLEFVAAPR